MKPAHIILIRIVGIPEPIAKYYARQAPERFGNRVAWQDTTAGRMLVLRNVKHVHPARTGENVECTVIVLRG